LRGHLATARRERDRERSDGHSATQGVANGIKKFDLALTCPASEYPPDYHLFGYHPSLA
jgi:hypothetical protein